MLPDRQSTPEKQLLRLIEESKETPSQLTKTKIIRQRKKLFSPAAWRAKLLFLKEGLSFKKRHTAVAYEFNLRWLNRLLEISVIVLGFYLISNIFSALNNLKKIPAFSPSSIQINKVVDFIQESILKKSSSYYLEKVSQRDIFNMEEKKTSAPTTLSEAAQEAVKNLRLVGVSWSENPDAMIEDTRAMRTFFVKTGQVLGDFKVKAIFKDRVILLYNNEEVELK